MPAATVIDQLIVKLGLDPRDFNKGQKEAARGIVETEKVVKKSSEGMTRSIVGFTGKLLGVATAAIAVKKAVSYMSDLSTSVRQLGIDSRNFGIAAAEMKNFQNIGEMMGGKAEDVTKTIGGITKAVYDLAYNGQINDSLIMLGRLGVRFQDTAGNARDFKDIVLDTEKAIQQSMKNGTSRANATQMLSQAGFDPGLVQAMIEGRVGPELAKQQTRRQVTGEVVQSATEWERSAANRDQSVEAAALRALPAAAAAGTALNNTIAGGADAGSTATVKGSLDAIGGTLSKGATLIERATKDFVEALEGFGGRVMRNQFKKGRAAYEDIIQAAAKRNGLDPEMLAGVLNTESGFDPAAYNAKSGAVGIAQLMPKYYPKAGRDPFNDIDDAAGELARLKKNFLAQGLNEDEATRRALQGYNAGETRVKGSYDGSGKPLRDETLQYPGKVLNYADQAVPTPGASGGSNGSSSSTSVNIGKVDVHTQATDADGIARDFAGATKRKVMAAHAETGMT